jgi:ABC-type multidrug transport system fused ATPase/permease subunit
MAMVLRFWDPDGGRITIDGQDLKTLSSSSLRASMAYVGQDAYLFDGTVADNIRAGLPDIDQTTVEEAARRAEAHTFITALPQGYETPVGELGSLAVGGAAPAHRHSPGLFARCADPVARRADVRT